MDLRCSVSVFLLILTKRFIYVQTMTYAPAPPVSSSVPIISAEWCVPVTPAIAMTVSVTEGERSPIVWVGTPHTY